MKYQPQILFGYNHNYNTSSMIKGKKYISMMGFTKIGIKILGERTVID